ncbi:hypothetical protein LCGC14_1021290 [marine sediment metagenome]|uniref:Uncharacterized protein n=1 Tax=marine sediment metagenome TaxID=412755 RepID=A0A0F9QFG4_9ZZZZ
MDESFKGIMKKKTIVLFTDTISLILMSVTIYGTGKPGSEGDSAFGHGALSDISIEKTGSEKISVYIPSM